MFLIKLKLIAVFMAFFLGYFALGGIITLITNAVYNAKRGK